MLCMATALVLTACGADDDDQPSRVVDPNPSAAPPSFVNAVLQAYIKASNTESDENFGYSGAGGASGVALNGDTLAISTSLEDSCATGINGDQGSNDCAGAGAVYVFTRINGV